MNPSPGEIRNELKRVLNSDVFLRSKRMTRFLRFLVERKLEGQEDTIDERAIATAVFDRPEPFDPRLDPTVRVEIGRLRSKLLEFYQTASGETRVTISVPRRTYVPIFKCRSKPVKRTEDGSAAVAVLPFADLTSGEDKDNVCAGLAVEIVNGLGRVGGIDVVANTSTREWNGRESDVRKLGTRLNATAILEGGVRRRGDRMRVTTRLISAEDGYCMWSDSFDFEKIEVLDAQIRVAEGVIRALRDRLAAVPV